MTSTERIQDLLNRIYGPEKGRQVHDRLMPLIEGFDKKPGRNASRFVQGEMVLITYGDTLRHPGEKPLATFHRFARRFLKDAVSSVHFLPFFPYSSDDGFSVKDFFRIDETLGDWNDVARIGEDFKLMFDFVINHFSAESQWFQNYLEDRPGFEHFAIEVDPAEDLSAVTRPRSLPLLTPFTKRDGRRVHLWTTFSADQIDFNYASLDVLEKMVQALLFYVEKGATILRLDAIAYLWKTVGTTCIHLPQTHDMVRLFRQILDIAAPEVMLITETNVPHEENISYFGSGRDEAQMVYNFTLPPLLLYTFVKQDATILTRWARGLNLPSPETVFFNFTASHDGIGVRPLEGILPAEEIDLLVKAVTANGGQVSCKDNPDGSQSPYELNITYMDAILADERSDKTDKFLASQALQYSLPGVPATYIHSLLGSRNWHTGVRKTGRARSINREKLNLERVLEELDDPASFRSRVFFPYLQMIGTWRRQPAFHPQAAFEVLDAGAGLFAIRRTGGGQTIHAVTNVSARPVTLDIERLRITRSGRDLVSGNRIDSATLVLAPYRFAWLEAP
ncbi:sucrose phosphorylase [Desulfosarcina widdelii]|uniref:Sucrose phosphorylase n=1 Tax=Desulfosarcina widdelii TaxID=947919 RepID=A0A5K7Z4Q6_9BACT|nr:alpha-amylase family glycosyl hydrolase [Desulfosarcina widdelii]BBO77002.1 sucrose phosphorylase [Desulfosarcina widdelii]